MEAMATNPQAERDEKLRALSLQAKEKFPRSGAHRLQLLEMIIVESLVWRHGTSFAGDQRPDILPVEDPIGR